jgi:hypothetical protein
MPMIQIAPGLSPLIRHAGSYQRQFQLTSKGIVVTETSKEPKMAAVIHAHACEVSQFVKAGMPAMMDGNEMMHWKSYLHRSLKLKLD